jgi:hypothetical protein
MHVSLLILFSACFLTAAEPINLVPQVPSYFCTWSSQAWAWRLWADDHPRKQAAAALVGATQTREGIDEQFLFGTPGLLKKGYEAVRSDLWVVIDDGLDVPYGTPHKFPDHSAVGSQILDPQRFP